MKITYLPLCVFLLLSTILQSQDATRRFITVNGQAKKVLAADGAVLRITISEQQPNEYARTGYVPFEASYTNFLEELFTIGIHENQLEQNTSNIPRYNPIESREYTLSLIHIYLSNIDDEQRDQLDMSTIEDYFDAQLKSIGICHFIARFVTCLLYTSRCV